MLSSELTYVIIILFALVFSPISGKHIPMPKSAISLKSAVIERVQNIFVVLLRLEG